MTVQSDLEQLRREIATLRQGVDSVHGDLTDEAILEGLESLTLTQHQVDWLASDLAPFVLSCIFLRGVWRRIYINAGERTGYAQTAMGAVTAVMATPPDEDPNQRYVDLLASDETYVGARHEMMIGFKEPGLFYPWVEHNLVRAAIGEDVYCRDLRTDLHAVFDRNPPVWEGVLTLAGEREIALTDPIHVRGPCPYPLVLTPRQVVDPSFYSATPELLGTIRKYVVSLARSVPEIAESVPRRT